MELDENKWCYIDFDKVNSLEDVIKILKALDVSFTKNHVEKHGIENLIKDE